MRPPHPLNVLLIWECHYKLQKQTAFVVWDNRLAACPIIQILVWLPRPDISATFAECFVGLPRRPVVVVLHGDVRRNHRGADLPQAPLHGSGTIFLRGQTWTPGDGLRLPDDGGALSMRSPESDERLQKQQEHQGNAYKVKPPFHL